MKNMSNHFNKLLKVCDVYANQQDVIYLVEVDEKNYVNKYIEVPLEKNKLNIALMISPETKQIDFHIKHATCVKVLMKQKIGWTNILFFDKEI